MTHSGGSDGDGRSAEQNDVVRYAAQSLNRKTDVPAGTFLSDNSYLINKAGLDLNADVAARVDAEPGIMTPQDSVYICPERIPRSATDAAISDTVD